MSDDIDIRTAMEAEPIYRRLLYTVTDDDVLEVMTGVSRRVFIFLDEKPGYFGYAGDWHSRLRRVRNGNNDLFDRLVP